MFARDNKTAPHQSRKKRELTRAVETLKHKYGGEGGIRTLDTLLTYTPLAGARLQPLGHFSKTCCLLRCCTVKKLEWLHTTMPP